MQDNLCTNRIFIAGAHLKCQAAVRLPVNSLCALLIRQRMDFRRIGNHENRIESQTEMSDNLLIICLILILFQKISRSGKGNLIDILFHFFRRHPQTIIGKGNRLFLRINFYVNSCLIVVRKRHFTHKFQFL